MAERVLPHVRDEVKLHALYADSIALELPFAPRYSLRHFGHAWLHDEVLYFLEICAAFAPLTEYGILTLTPNIADLLTIDRTNIVSETHAHHGDSEYRLAMNAFGIDWVDGGLPSLTADFDPFGPLDGAYLDAMIQFGQNYRKESRKSDLARVIERSNEQWFRGERLSNVVYPLLDGFRYALATRNRVTPLTNSRDIAVLKRLISTAGGALSTELGTRASDLDAILAFSPVLDLDLPIYDLSYRDMAELRRDGYFQPFRAELQKALLAASAQPPLLAMVLPRRARTGTGTVHQRGTGQPGRIHAQHVVRGEGRFSNRGTRRVHREIQPP